MAARGPDGRFVAPPPVPPSTCAAAHRSACGCWLGEPSPQARRSATNHPPGPGTAEVHEPSPATVAWGSRCLPDSCHARCREATTRGLGSTQCARTTELRSRALRSPRSTRTGGSGRASQLARPGRSGLPARKSRAAGSSPGSRCAIAGGVSPSGLRGAREPWSAGNPDRPGRFSGLRGRGTRERFSSTGLREAGTGASAMEGIAERAIRQPRARGPS